MERLLSDMFKGIKKDVKIVIGIVVSAGALLVLYLWNPKIENHKSMEYKNDIKTENEIYFSKEPGFYSEEFTLEIHAPTNDIFYTLDGSEPSNESKRYIQPIVISDATRNENVYSLRTDTSTGFYEDLIEEYSSRSVPEYKVPAYNIDKCTVVRAVYYDENGEKSEIVTGTYFVGFDDKPGYEGINVICITTDPDNLFDYNNGIYVTGKAFDEFVAKDGLVKSVNPMSAYWWMWGGNYQERGNAAERDATVQLFNSDGENVLTENVGIRLQGMGSRGYISKSINIFARKKYNGNTRLHYDFWSTGYIPDAVTLTSCGDDQYSKIRDRLVAEASRSAGLEFATMHFEPYALFLNGEYWGFYYITEKYDEEYISNYYQVASNNVVIVKHGSIEVGEDSDLLMYNKMIHFLETADMADQDNYTMACDLVDMQSMVDYFATEIYVSRYGDWEPGYNNTAMWRAREKGNGKYEDGKWRWMLFDQNSGGLTSDLTDFDALQNARSSPMFNNLCQNKDFREALAKKIIELGKGAFSKNNIDIIISEYIVQLEEPMNLHMQRFWGIDNERFHTRVQSTKDFFDGRFEPIVGCLKKNFSDLDIEGMLDE